MTLTGNTPTLAEMPGAPTPPARRPSSERLVFLDALRGVALIFMVLNHTGRWWQDRSMGWPWYYSIYVTMAVAAPTFLFLVGFCLPISLTKTRGAIALQLLPTIWKYAKRGGRIILGGLLLNVLVFPEDPSWSKGILHNLLSTQEPLWSNGVLQTIGLGIIVAAPIGLFVRSVTGRCMVVTISVLLYLWFGWAFEFLKGWVTVHPAAARLLFFEFPPWPWIALVIFGLVPGQMFLEQIDQRGRSRYMIRMAAVGAVCIAWLLLYDRWAKTPKPFTFMRDYILYNHWTPRGASAVWVIGMTFCLMALVYYLAEVRKLRMTWLVTLGQTALFLYFVHQLIVLTLVNQHLHMKFNNWWYYGLANLALMLVLLGLGRGWIEIKRIYRQRVPPQLAFRRA
jgi:uncharacterized membrane protein